MKFNIKECYLFLQSEATMDAFQESWNALQIVGCSTQQPFEKGWQTWVPRSYRAKQKYGESWNLTCLELLDRISWNNQLFIECGESGARAHRVNFLSGRDQYCATHSGYGQAICTVLSFSSIPDQFLPTLRDKVPSKNYCSLGQYATASSKLHVCQKFCRCCLSFILSSWFPVFLQNNSNLPFPPCLH